MDQTSSQLPTAAPAAVAPAVNGEYTADRAGQQFGNYRLLRLLAIGGFADVYLGEHIHLRTNAAIKLLRTRLAEEDVKQFSEEARIVASLRHPHIVSILDFAVSQGIPFLVMDYAPNGTLRQRHARGSQLAPNTILSYLKQVGDALQYAHNERLIHCDLKPENILVGRKGEILLSDFGIAVVAQSSRFQLTQAIIGTISYMPPEQLHGRPVLASDQYALGIMAYEWLCGVCPFRGSVTEIMAQHINASPPSLRERVPGLSPVLEQVVMTALAKESGQRYASVVDFVAAFEAALLSQPRLILPATPAQVEKTLLSQATLPDVDAPPDTPWGEATQYTPFLVPVLSGSGQRVSRRSIVLGISGLAATGLLGGGVAWWARAHPFTRPMSTAKARSLPTPQPIGTTFVIYRGHFRGVSAVAWVPVQGTYIASGSKDLSAHVWYTSNAITLTSYGGHGDAVNAIACLDDGSRIASGSADKTVQVWDTNGGGHVYTYSGHGDVVNSVAWSPDGAHIASGSSDHTVQVWNPADGSNAYTYSGHEDAVNSVAWSPDSQRIASGSTDHSVQIWSAVDGSNAVTYSGHGDIVNAVAWSPDGKYIASGGADKTVQVWDAASQKLAYTYQGHSDIVNAIAWSPDSQRIASGSTDHSVQVWHAFNGGQRYTFPGHSDAVNSVAWSFDGTAIASGSNDTTVQVWKAV
ncbi:MAG: serine/threonine protein kinase [Chloroflexota bacterium]|nr:serine/threonine protein kinase [Chloroflexota bacterium]